MKRIPLTMVIAMAGTGLFLLQDAQTRPRSQEWSLKAGSDSSNAVFTFEVRDGHGHWRNTNPVPWISLQGLDRTKIAGFSVPAKFQFVRDAGSLACEGTFHLGRGSGTFVFQPNPGYQDEMEKLGFRLREESRHAFALFVADVPLEFAKAVRAANVDATVDELQEMRVHGLDQAYLLSVHSAGYTDLHPRDLIEMKIHGVSRKDLQALQSLGLKPPPGDLVQMRIHGVDPAYLKGLKDAGFENIAMEEAVQMRIHGVSTEFARAAHDLGYRFRPEEIRELRIHGVDSAYLRRLKDSGFSNLSAEKITQLHMHGVD